MSYANFYFFKHITISKNVDICTNYILQRLIIRMKILEYKTNLEVPVKWGDL